VVLQLPEPPDLRNESRGWASRGLCCRRVLQEVIFRQCNLIASGPRGGCEPFLRDAGDFENPFARMSRHMALLREKKIDTVHMLSLEDVRVH